MSTPLAVFFWAVWVIGTLFCAWKALTAIADRRREQRHDIGPDALLLLQELDAHLDEYLLANPDIAAGFNRLRDAIRDHRTEDTP